MRAGADNFGWKLNYGSIAMIWRAGCIIRRSSHLTSYALLKTNYCARASNLLFFCAVQIPIH